MCVLFLETTVNMFCDTGQKFRCLNDATASQAYYPLSPFNLGTGSSFGCTGVVLRRIQHVDVMVSMSCQDCTWWGSQEWCSNAEVEIQKRSFSLAVASSLPQSSKCLIKRCERRHIWTLSITISWAPVPSQSFIFMWNLISRCFLQSSRPELRDLFSVV